MAVNPTKINFPSGVNCCDSTISADNKLVVIIQLKLSLKI